MNPKPRMWAQLTYTSADAIAGVQGGWGVKQTTDGIASEVQNVLRDGVTTRIEEQIETPEFASDAELQNRVRRMSFRRVDGLVAMWHACPAGPDASGRPGNVYTHAAGLIGGDANFRPIEYWRSADWLEPFGPSKASAARLGTLSPGTRITRESVIAFLREDDRLFQLEWMLAAVSDAGSRDAAVVVGADSADEAAWWIAAITLMTAPLVGQRLGWVTFDRLHRLPDLLSQGFRLIGTPYADLEELQRQGSSSYTLVDPRWQVADPVDGRWRTPAASFPADPSWQNGMLDLLNQQEYTVRVLRDMDESGAGMTVADSEHVPFSWPLAMAMMSDPKIVVREIDHLAVECMAAVRPSMLTLPHVQKLVERMREGYSLDEARKITHTHGVGLTGQVYVAAVVEARAFLVGEWLTQTDLPPMFSAFADALGAALVAEAAAALKQAAVTATQGPTEVLAGARLVTFLRLGLGMGQDPSRALTTTTSQLNTRIARDDLDGDEFEDEIWQLSPELSLARRDKLGAKAAVVPAVVVPEPAPSAPRQTAARAQWAWTNTDRANPAGVGFSETVASVAAPAPVVTLPKVVAADPVAVDDALPQGIQQAMVRLVSRETAGSERYFAMVDLWRAQGGLKHIPLRAGVELGGDDLELALRLWQADSAGLPGEIYLGWLASYYAIAEVEASANGLSAPQPPPEIVAAVAKAPDAAILEIGRLFLESPPAAAARLFYWSLHREVGSFGSFLGTVVAGTDRLGWAAVSTAFQRLDRQQSEAVLALVDLKELRGFGSKVDKTLAAIGGVAPDTTPPPPSGKRKKD